MKKQAAKKLEIFLFLALRQAARRSNDFPLAAVSENENAARSEDGNRETSDENFFAFVEQLSEAEAERFGRLRLHYEKKSADEQKKWRERVARSIGGEENELIDECVHRSRVEAAIKREIPAIQKIVARALSPLHEDSFAAKQKAAESDLPNAVALSSTVSARLEKTICRAFAAQFVRLEDLPPASVFDKLNGAQMARLARFAGIREVAYACAGIDAVEAVAGFLRRFAPEDARAVAAQIGGLPKVSGERLAFAETLVASALEIEPKPSSAMLDWLGIRLVGILLCAPENEAESSARIRYAEQKLPLETEPGLSKIIDKTCRSTPADLKSVIAAEIERLAETIYDGGRKT